MTHGEPAQPHHGTTPTRVRPPRCSARGAKGRGSVLDDKNGSYLSTHGWPRREQGAYVLGRGHPAVSPHQRPVPIASVAKVMTAYLVLEHHPLHAGDSGALLGHDRFVGMKTGSDEAAGGCLMFRAVWPAESGDRSLIGVVLGQRGGNLIAAGLDAAKQLVERLAPSAVPGEPRLAASAGAYRRHIENRIRAGNAPLP